MKMILYYFSGTGNSLYVTKKLSCMFEASQIIPIAKKPDLKKEYTETVGIIFPTYMHRPPHIVADFIKNLPKAEFVFVIATNAGETGKVFSTCRKLLKTNGNTLNSGFIVKMPSNYVPFGEAVDGVERNELFREADKKIELISGMIKNKNEQFDPESNWFSLNINPGLMYKMGYKFIHYLSKNFYTDSNCSGCGICEKICPVNNITLKEKKPLWGKKCEQCLACLNYCPENSIQFGKKTPGLKRYHHPEINFKEIALQK